MYDDFEDEDGAETFSLNFNAKYGSTQVSVYRNFRAEDLTSILTEMVQFLQAAGYTYVDYLEAGSANNDITHSSNL